MTLRNNERREEPVQKNCRDGSKIAMMAIASNLRKAKESETQSAE